MELILTAIWAFIGGFAGVSAAFAFERWLPNAAKQPETPKTTKRVPNYNTPERGAAFLAGQGKAREMPSTWIKP